MELLKISINTQIWRNVCTSSRRSTKVAVLGCASGVGQALSLLLKTSPYVSQLSLYDIEHSIGVATDLSHINSSTVVKGFCGPDYLPCALDGAEVVAITAGETCIPGKKDYSRDDLFKPNAPIVQGLIETCATVCPKALIAIVTNPVNSVVVVAAEVLQRCGVYDPKRLFGVTSIDAVRASTFVGNLKGVDPHKVHVPCVGGHSFFTTVPLLSQCKPKMQIKDDEVVSLTKQIQTAGSDVFNAKDFLAATILASGFSCCRFVTSLCRGLKGEKNVVECTYVSSNVTEAPFFASPVLLGICGIERIYPLPAMTKFERKLTEIAVAVIRKNVEAGEKFMCQ